MYSYKKLEKTRGMKNPIADETRKDNVHTCERKERKSPTNRKKGIIQA
jgi:hypothetical protein